MGSSGRVNGRGSGDFGGGAGDIVIPFAPQGAESSSQVEHDKLRGSRGGCHGDIKVLRQLELNLEDRRKNWMIL